MHLSTHEMVGAALGSGSRSAPIYLLSCGRERQDQAHAQNLALPSGPLRRKLPR
jgi:hypothetical protein